MSIKTINGVLQEWARVKVLVVTLDNGATWQATTPAFPGLRGTGRHQDLAAADLLCAIAAFANESSSDVQTTLKNARKAELQRRAKAIVQ